MKDKNKQLMLARGSKTGAYDADAPDQWKFNLRHGKGEVRGMAWIQSKTIALGHESPYCVDEHAKALWIEHIALECGWTEQTARNYLTKFEKEGRVRLDHKKKQIWYCAEVPLAYTELPEDFNTPTDQEDPENPESEPENCGSEGRNKSEDFNYVHSYRDKFINNLPLQKRQKALKTVERLSEWKDQFISDGVAALRSIADEVEDITWLNIGLPKKRLAKRRPEKTEWVQVKLFEEPNFVHSCAEFVQSGGSTLYKLEIRPFRFVQSDPDSCASLLCSTPTPTPTKEESAAQTQSAPTTVSARSDLHKKTNHRSVGRSSSGVVEEPEPTDRPTNDRSLQNLREFLESTVHIPGFPLEDGQVREIAATMQTDLHRQQFEEAVHRVKDPRGWKAIVTVAKNCVAEHERYARLHENKLARTAAANGPSDEEKAYWEEKERRRPKPCTPVNS